MGKVTSNKTLKRSGDRIKVMKWLLWILEDGHLIQLRSLGRFPGGLILKFSSGRQALKDLQHLEGLERTKARERGLFWPFHSVS